MSTARTFRSHDGLALAADSFGDEADRPVLLMHGGGQTRHAWKRTAEQLVSTGWYAVALDLRGHGDSAWAPDGHYEIDDFALDVRGVAAELGQPTLVGASLGGMSSLLAIGESDVPVASALVLVDIVTEPDPAGVDRIRAFMRSGFDGFETLDDVADAVANYLPHRRRPADSSGLLKNVRLRDGKYVWHWDPAFFSRVEQAHGEPTAGSFSPVDRLDRAARRITVPTLLVRGGESDVVTDAGVHHLLEVIPHARSVEVDGAGHMVAGDQNDAFSLAVGAFLADLPDTPSR